MIRVLVVDDAASVRRYLSYCIHSEPDMEVVGTATHGVEALTEIERLKPDVVTLDVQMPRMDGIETLQIIMERFPLPVLMVSVLTSRDAETTLKALEAGAMDYMLKPVSFDDSTKSFAKDFVSKVRSISNADVPRILRIRRENRAMNRARGSARTPSITSNTNPDRRLAWMHDKVIVIGISTGGPPALYGLFAELRPPMPPIVVVQHMPAMFTQAFAQRLNEQSELDIKEGEIGDVLAPNRVLVAPGGLHMTLTGNAGHAVVNLVKSSPVYGHRPSIDRLMQSAASIYGENCLAVIMTGMGTDGVDGCQSVQTAGGYVLGQDQMTSDVYGMNKAAFKAGYVDQQFSLYDLPGLLQRHFLRARQQRPPVAVE